MKKNERKNLRKDYEVSLFTWTKSSLGKYKALKKLNKLAYKKSKR